MSTKQRQIAIEIPLRDIGYCGISSLQSPKPNDFVVPYFTWQWIKQLYRCLWIHTHKKSVNTSLDIHMYIHICITHSLGIPFTTRVLEISHYCKVVVHMKNNYYKNVFAAAKIFWWPKLRLGKCISAQRWVDRTPGHKSRGANIKNPWYIFLKKREKQKTNKKHQHYIHNPPQSTYKHAE